MSFVSLSVPESALGYWKDCLTAHGFDVSETERFDRLLDLPLPYQGDAEVVAGIDEIGLRLERAAKVEDG